MLVSVLLGKGRVSHSEAVGRQAVQRISTDMHVSILSDMNGKELQRCKNWTAANSSRKLLRKSSCQLLSAVPTMQAM